MGQRLKDDMAGEAGKLRVIKSRALACLLGAPEVSLEARVIVRTPCNT